jgi:hypothetical protein
VDHEDGDGLNNRCGNIRLATPSQNQANKVWKDKKRPTPYRASIKPNGKTIHLGSFATPEEAAAAYKGAAKVLFGKFARAE